MDNINLPKLIGKSQEKKTTNIYIYQHHRLKSEAKKYQHFLNRYDFILYYVVKAASSFCLPTFFLSLFFLSPSFYIGIWFLIITITHRRHPRISRTTYFLKLIPNDFLQHNFSTIKDFILLKLSIKSGKNVDQRLEIYCNKI